MKVEIRPGASPPAAFDHRFLEDNGAELFFTLRVGGVDVYVAKQKDEEPLGAFSLFLDSILLDPCEQEFDYLSLHCEGICINTNEAQGIAEYRSLIREFSSMANAFVSDDWVFATRAEPRVIRLKVISPETPSKQILFSVITIRLKKSLGFQQGKSVQRGKNSDASLTRKIGIPPSTLHRWSKDHGWRRKLYDLLKEINPDDLLA